MIYNVGHLTAEDKLRVVKGLEQRFNKEYSWGHSSGEIEDALFIGFSPIHPKEIVTVNLKDLYCRIFRDEAAVMYEADNLHIGEL